MPALLAIASGIITLIPIVYYTGQVYSTPTPRHHGVANVSFDVPSEAVVEKWYVNSTVIDLSTDDTDRQMDMYSDTLSSEDKKVYEADLQELFDVLIEEYP